MFTLYYKLRRAGDASSRNTFSEGRFLRCVKRKVAQKIRSRAGKNAGVWVGESFLILSMQSQFGIRIGGSALIRHLQGLFGHLANDD